MNRHKTSWTLLIASLSMLAPNLASSAHAFQQTMTCNPDGIYRCKQGETPLPVQWPSITLSYSINNLGSKEIPNRSDGTIGPELLETIHKSFDVWTQPSCTELSFEYKGLTDETNIGYFDGPAPNKNVNMVIWRDDAWPYGSFSAVALTTVTFSTTTGQIVDADIELNGATFPFSNTDFPSGSDVDIQNTLTHEVGHFIGLDHSSSPLATMFPTAPPLELSKRVLDQDDIDGLCHIYPLGFKPEPLTPKAPPEKKSWFCSMTTFPNQQSQTPSTPIAAFAALAGIAIWTRRTKRKKS